MKNKPQTRLSDNDTAILNFLWRWKLATTAALAQRFYPRSTRNAAYQRLWKLERAGFIRARFDETGNHCVWVLDKKGFAVVMERIAPLKDAGYFPSNWRHDLLVSAIHLGDGVFEDGPHLENVTEQEARRIDPEFLGKWLPFPGGHRPDGYWRIDSPSGKKLIILEVELTQKRDMDYQSIAHWIECDDVHAVLWIVPRASLAKSIQKNIEKSWVKPEVHSYVLLDAIIEKGWQAPIILGFETGKSIGDLLETQPRQPQEPNFMDFWMDTRKKPDYSKPPRIFRPTEFP